MFFCSPFWTKLSTSTVSRCVNHISPHTHTDTFMWYIFIFYLFPLCLVDRIPCRRHSCVFSSTFHHSSFFHRIFFSYFHSLKKFYTTAHKIQLRFFSFCVCFRLNHCPIRISAKVLFVSKSRWNVLFGWNSCTHTVKSTKGAFYVCMCVSKSVSICEFIPYLNKT